MVHTAINCNLKKFEFNKSFNIGKKIYFTLKINMKLLYRHNALMYWTKKKGIEVVHVASQNKS